MQNQFLAGAETLLHKNDSLAAGLHAACAAFQDKEMQTANLPKPLPHYVGLLNEAKKLALQTRQRAHAPFSNFLVGAALIADDESLHIGCNVECSSYGLTICAERTALVSAVAQGKKRFLGVAVAADTENLTPPCGACRQLLYDFAPDAVVVLVNPQGAEKYFTMKELLPEAFTVAFL